MVDLVNKRKKSLAYKIISGFILLSFLSSVVMPPQAMAQTPFSVTTLPVPGTMTTLSPGFTPPLMRGVSLFPDNPLKFNFVMDEGDMDLDGASKKEEYEKLIKYFLASLTIPDRDLWVNLSPNEEDRIITDELALTEMGRDMLSQDYVLKQLAASMPYPESNLGRKFWDRVYTKARKMYNTTNIPVSTFNKIWIVPQKAVVYEQNGNAFVAESSMKVMLEEDYIAMQKHLKAGASTSKVTKEEAEELSRISSEVVRNVLLPEIQKEINGGKNFAPLRQVYHSMILAAWYKRTLRNSLLGQVYIGQAKVKGIDVADKEMKEKIYARYMESLKKGAYDYIKKDIDPRMQKMKFKRYFSGGHDLTTLSPKDLNVIKNSSLLSRRAIKDLASLADEVPDIVLTDLVENATKQEVLKISSVMERRRVSPTAGGADTEQEGPSISSVMERRRASPKAGGADKAVLAAEASFPYEDIKSLPIKKIKGKVFAVLVDFNVPRNPGGSILDDTRLRGPVRTIKYLTALGAKVFLMSHLGRPEGRVVDSLSLLLVRKRLSELLGIDVMFNGKSEIKEGLKWRELQNGEVMLLENTRFSPDEKRLAEAQKAVEKAEKEPGNIPEYAELLDARRQARKDHKKAGAGLFAGADYVVIEGPSVLHRDYLSVTGAPDGIPKLAGFLVRDELIAWQKAKGANVHVVGGAKVSDKIGYIGDKLKDPKTKRIFIGGTMLNVFLKADGVDVGASKGAEAKEVAIAAELMKHPAFADKVSNVLDYLAVNKFVDEDDTLRKVFLKGEEIPEGWMIVDIGPQTQKAWNEEIRELDASDIIFWNGPLGARDILSFAKNGNIFDGSKAPLYIGGGETGPVADMLGVKYDYRSTAGGALQDYLNNKKLPGLDQLPKKKGTVEPANQPPVSKKPTTLRLMKRWILSGILNKGDKALLAEVESAAQEFMREEAPEMMRQINEVFRATPDQIPELVQKGNKFAVLGFEHEKANRMGFILQALKWVLDTPEGQKALDGMLADAKEIRDNFDTIVFAGMGGSGLSVEKVRTIFGTEGGPKIISLRDTDPTAIKDVLDEVVANAGDNVREALEKLKIVVISKSGGTVETIGHLKYFLKIYELYGIDPREHIIIYTDPGSKMDWQKHVGKDFSKDPVREELQQLLEKIRPRVRFIQLDEGTDIGGRTTAPLTNVFLLPTAILMGDQVKTILRRAREMNDVSVEKNIFIKLGVYLHTLAEVYGIDKVNFVVPKEIKDVFIWSEQLFEESLGKEGKGISIFLEDDLTMDMLKPVDENDRVFLRVNLGGEETHKEFINNVKKKGYPVFDLNLRDKLDIGGLDLGLQITKVTMGYRWNIVSIDQDPVERYKTENSEIKKALKKDEIAGVPKAYEAGSAFYGKLMTQYYQPVLDAAEERIAFLKKVDENDDNIPISVQTQRLIDYGFIKKEDYIADYKAKVLPKLRRGIITREKLEAKVASLGADMNNAAAIQAALYLLMAEDGSLEVADIYSFGRMSPGFKGVLGKARKMLGQQFKIPGKDATGPGYLHSTFVNSMDGPDVRIPTLILPDKVNQPDFYKKDPEIVEGIRRGEIDEKMFWFDENELRIPAFGTIAALTKGGRKSVLITLKEGIDQLGEEGLAEIEQFYKDVEMYISLDKWKGANEYIFGGGFGYDIRITNTDKDLLAVAGLSNKIGRTFGGGKYLNHKGKALVTSDHRNSSPAMRSAIIQGLLDEGIDVTTQVEGDVITTGLTTRKGLTDDFDLIVQITGSHNPKEDNGLKITYKGKPFYQESLLELSAAVDSKEGWSDGTIEKGLLTEDDKLIEEHTKILASILPDLKRPPSVIADYRGGVAGKVVNGIAKLKGYNVIRFNPEKDDQQVIVDSFQKNPDQPLWISIHEEARPDMRYGIWDPSKGEAYTAIIELQDELRQHEVLGKIAFDGITYDGDGDRSGFLTHKGKIIAPDRMLINFYVRMIYENIEGIKVLNKLGHTFSLAMDVRASSVIKEEMKRVAAANSIDLIGEFIAAGYPEHRRFVLDEMTKIQELAAQNAAKLDDGEKAAIQKLLLDYPSAEASGHFFFNLMDAEAFLEKKSVIDDGITAGFRYLSIVETLDQYELKGKTDKTRFSVEDADAVFLTLPQSPEVRLDDAPKDVVLKQKLAEDIVLKISENNPAWFALSHDELKSEIEKARKNPPQRQHWDDPLLLVDGVRIELNNGVWFLYRKSNTSPKITNKNEADALGKEAELLDTMRKMVEAIDQVVVANQDYSGLKVSDLQQKIQIVESWVADEAMLAPAAIQILDINVGGGTRIKEPLTVDSLLAHWSLRWDEVQPKMQIDKVLENLVRDGYLEEGQFPREYKFTEKARRWRLRDEDRLSYRAKGLLGLLRQGEVIAPFTISQILELEQDLLSELELFGSEVVGKTLKELLRANLISGAEGSGLYNLTQALQDTAMLVPSAEKDQVTMSAPVNQVLDFHIGAAIQAGGNLEEVINYLRDRFGYERTSTLVEKVERELNKRGRLLEEQIAGHYNEGEWFTSEELVDEIEDAIGWFTKEEFVDKIKDAIGSNAVFDRLVQTGKLDYFAKTKQYARKVHGGIDFNSELLDLQIKRDGNGVPLPLLQQPIETMNIEGFYPVIINIAPAVNLPLLMGLNVDSDAETSFDTDISWYMFDEWFIKPAELWAEEV